MSIEERIAELAAEHFRMSGANLDEAEMLVEFIYSALEQVQEEQKA